MDMNFNIPLNGVETRDDFTPIPAGPQPVTITATDIRQTKAGTGLYVWCEFTVTAGDHRGRKVFEHFNIQHPNPTVVEIGLRTIKEMIIACGGTGSESLTPALVKALEGRELVVTLYIEKDEKYGEQNRIKSFSPVRDAIQPPAAFDDPVPAAFGGQPTRNPWDK